VWPRAARGPIHFQTVRNVFLLAGATVAFGCSAAGGYDGDVVRRDGSVDTSLDETPGDDVGAETATAEVGDGAVDGAKDDALDSGAGLDSAAPGDGGPDATSIDTSTTDTGVDTGTVDTGTADTGTVDTGIADTGTVDTGSCVCTTPPVADCADGATARTYSGPGTCPDGGACVYPSTLAPCTAPPATACVGSSVRKYTSPGTCGAGACSYAYTDTACPGGCAAGACVDACSVSLTYDFESGDQGFTHAPLSTFASDDPWVRGTPSGTTTCHGGTKCWSTGLTAAYTDCQTAELRFPTINLSACAGSTKKVTLSFWHWYDFEAKSSGKYWDGGLLQISTDGTTWTDVATSQAYDGAITGDYTGCSPTPLVSGKSGWSAAIPGGAWKQVTYEITAPYRVAALRLRFLFGSDAATTKRGWFVDDVSITSSP